ncbi:MAG TPA: alpha/beta fold hydrolase [Methylomirabilota bacterium]|nr:alpha/beta fold hydrolase [Methylomirabilota bacterium]
MPYATLNGIRVHYETYGAGDPVLLINGLGGPAVSWLYQVRDLSKRYRVITFDNRGVGETDLPEAAAYPTGLMAEDARALLDHLEVERAHVVGASMGGTISMELAIRHARRVRSLGLLCTWARGDGRFLHTVQSWMATAAVLSPEDRFRYAIMPWVYTAKVLGDSTVVEDLVKRTMAYPFPTRPAAFERQGRGLLEWNGTRITELRRLRIPTLVLVGRDDILTPPTFSRELARLIPKARLRIVPGGHGFFIEEPDHVNRALLRFLAGIKR